MTNEQILELVKEYFEVGGIRDDGTCSEYYGNPDAFLKFAQSIIKTNDFYRKRCELLQKVQKYMRDPERTIVCDILANNSLLPDPSGVRYGQDLLKLIGD